MGKYIIKIFSFLFFLSIINTACKKSGDMIVAKQGTLPGLTADKSELNYTIDDSASNAVTFTYTPTSYGYSAAINYNLQFSYNDSNFSSTADYTFASGSMSFTVAAFNTLLLGLKYQAGVTDTILVRVKASAADSLYTYSDTVGIVVSPYAQPRVIVYPFLYAPGAYQGWNFGGGEPPTIIAKLYSTKSNSAYEGYINITDTTNGNGQFKLAPANSWNYSFSEVTATTFASSGNNFSVTKGPGYYLIDADTSTKKWAATIQNWSIIGDAANGWSAPANDIAFDFDDTDQVLVKTLDLKAGGIKFIMNGSFDVSYGIQKDPNDNTKDLAISPLGEVPIATSNTDNIPITVAGTYKITLDLRVPSEPVCTLVKQ
ncbi:MAG: SusE domain-containing protein [Arachidicoccus sp.]|nr:SusE domain-containing protein [Arachidicoccus sp.]